MADNVVETTPAFVEPSASVNLAGSEELPSVAIAPPSDVAASRQRLCASKLPSNLENLPVDAYDSIADDCLRVLSDPSAFSQLIAALEADLSTLAGHQHAVIAEMDQLTSQTLPRLGADVKALRVAADDLEVIFTRIDVLQEVMDGVQRAILQLSEVLKNILEAASVKERASGLLRSFGKVLSRGASKEASETSARAAGVWSRVPVDLTIDGLTPLAFHRRIVDTLKRIAADVPASHPVATTDDEAAQTNENDGAAAA